MVPPYVVKPPAEGSSFGVLIVPADAAHPPQQLGTDAWPYGDTVMVERYIPGRELTCGVMGDTPLGVIEVVPAGDGFYDYDAKYRPAGRATFFRRRLNLLFTKMSKDLLSRLTGHSDAVVSVGRTSASTTAATGPATSSASR